MAKKKPSPVEVPFALTEWPANRVEMWSLDKIKPYPNNARTHPQEQIDALARDMRDDGVTMPILVDAKGVIIAGHGRKMAAEANGFEEYPVMVARGWTAQQIAAARIKDNQRGLQSGWDIELLRLEIQDLKLDGYDIPLLGFPDAELNSIMLPDVAGNVDPEKTPEPPKKPVVKPGDLWILGNHRLICGDSTNSDDVKRVVGNRTPHLMCTDPPYGVNYDPNWRNEAARTSVGMGNRAIGAGAVGKVSNDDRADWTDAWALFSGDVAYVWHGGLHADVVISSLLAVGFEKRSQIIWDKGRMIIGRGDYHWQHEPCWYVVRKGRTGHWNGDRTQKTVWTIPHQVSETGHGTQKPIECMKRPIENNSKKGDWIYEPFCGSGTTLIACEMTGRKCLAIELDPAYCEVIIRRWQEFSGELAKLESGETLDEITKSRRRGIRSDGGHPQKRDRGTAGGEGKNGGRRGAVAAE